VVAYLGEMGERGRLGVKHCAEGHQDLQRNLLKETDAEWVEVDLKRVRVERSRKFGGAWLGQEMIRRLGLDRFLALRRNLIECPFYAAFCKTMNSVLVAAIR
jgi:hypothetical protein